MKLKPLTPEQNNLLCDIAIHAMESCVCNEVEIPIEHFVYEGVYYRTCFIPTTVIVSGDCYVTLGNTVGRLKGYNVIQAESGRRQAFRALEDTHITMCFRTDKVDLRECEKEFTPEWMLLTTNRKELIKE